jgi:hypothetical protein
MLETIICRVGNTCVFVATIGSGDVPLDTRYSAARFVVREKIDSPTTLIDVDQSDGIFIDHAASKVTVTLGATLTQDISLPLPRNTASELRLINPSDPDDRIGWPIPFSILPSVIPA